MTKVFVSLLIRAISKPTNCGESTVLFLKKLQFIIWKAKNGTLQNFYLLVNLLLFNIPGASATDHVILDIN